MKKKIAAVLILSIFILTSCQGKNAVGTNGSGTSSTNATVKNVTTIKAPASNATNEKVNTQGNLQPVKLSGVPPLNQTQKEQVSNKFDSVLKDINTSLKSLDDPDDLDLSPIN